MKPLFKICEDMDARLAINQGYTRPGDYRDALQSIIEQSSLPICLLLQTVGLDEGYLSCTLNKRQHISMKNWPTFSMPWVRGDYSGEN